MVPHDNSEICNCSLAASITNLSWKERIKQRMRIAGFTQDALGKSLGCTRAAIGHYLSGRRRPKLEQLEAMARALEVNPAWLVYGVGPADTIDKPGSNKGTPEISFPLLGDSNSGPVQDRANARKQVRLPRDCYALTVATVELAPHLRQGDFLLVSPSHPPTVGNRVVVGDSVGKREVLFLVSLDEEHALLERPQPHYQRILKPLTEIEFMHKVIAIAIA